MKTILKFLISIFFKFIPKRLENKMVHYEFKIMFYVMNNTTKVKFNFQVMYIGSYLKY